MSMSRDTVRLVAAADFELPELNGRPLPSRTFTETYFDTSDSRLARAGFSLRRRVENGKGVWKLSVRSDGAALDVDSPGGPKAPPTDLEELVSAASAGFALGPVAKLRTSVGGIRVRQGRHSLAKIELSSIAVLDGQRTIRELREIEMHPLAADGKQLARIGKALRKAGAKRADGSPVYQRAVPAELPVEAPAATPALERLRAFIREQHAHVLAHDPGVRLSSDPEEVHQLRVAVRRLRSVLRTASGYVEAAWAERLREELAWLGGELGPARDLDVLLGHLRGEVAGLAPADRRAFRQVLTKLEREREAAQAQVLEALRSERYAGLLATLEGGGASPPPGPEDGELVAAARADLDRLRKALAKLDGDQVSDEVLHKARIRGKRARYAVELVEDDLGRPATRLVRRLKRFQDVTGEHQDAVVAEQRIRDLAGATRSPRCALAAGILVGRQRDRRRRSLAALPDAWDRVDEAAAKVWS
jgi:CHAD domain-containing protein